MRKSVAIMGLVGLLAQSVMVGSAMAQPVQGGVKTSTTYADNPVREVVLLPVRVVAGAVGAPVGAIGGMAKRSSQAVDWVNANTFKQVVADDEEIMEKPAKQFGRGVVLVPLGIAGTAAAVGVGSAVGAVEGTFRGLAKGFTWPDNR